MWWIQNNNLISHCFDGDTFMIHMTYICYKIRTHGIGIASLDNYPSMRYWIWARIFSLARSKLRLCAANHIQYPALWLAEQSLSLPRARDRKRALLMGNFTRARHIYIYIYSTDDAPHNRRSQECKQSLACHGQYSISMRSFSSNTDHHFHISNESICTSKKMIRNATKQNMMCYFYYTIHWIHYM